MKRFVGLMLICLLLVACSAPKANPTTQAPPQPTLTAAPSATDLPTPQTIENTPEPAPTEMPTALPTQAPIENPNPIQAPIIIDNESTDISQIPPEWLEKAKTLTVAFAHTSHGSQIVTGLLWLQAQDPRYAVAVRSTWDGFGLPEGENALRLYDGNNIPDNDYITPELYWSAEEGLNYTRSVAGSGLFDVNLWAWCGQQSENDEATVQQYIAALQGLEAEFPQVRFIYFTGHTDGNGDGSRLLENNQVVRAFAVENNKVLFDFASIESYDPDGNYYPNTDDSCPWCQSWCDAHPDQCANLDQMGDCAHTHPLQCKLKAQAFWYLMARLAGWDGQ